MSASTNPVGRRVVGVLTAIVSGLAAYYVDPAPSLAAFIGLSFGLAVWLMLRNQALAPDRLESGLKQDRWNGLMAGFTTAAALLGVLPQFDSIRGLTIALLVVGVGFGAAQCGIASVLEEESPADEEATPSTG